MSWHESVASRGRPSNNGLQLTKAARCAPFRSLTGQSLRAAFAAEPECSTGTCGWTEWREGAAL